MMMMTMMIGMMIIVINGHKDDYDYVDAVWLMDMIRGSIDRWYW
jgi:hypothetical protein